MKFWKRYSVCSECGVHFEPVTGYEAHWGNLCAIHRKPVKEKDERKDRIIAWALSNLDSVEKLMNEEKKKHDEMRNKAFNQAMQSNLSQMANYQAQQAAAQNLSNLGNLGNFTMTR